jgi:hypothetical protein
VSIPGFRESSGNLRVEVSIMTSLSLSHLFFCPYSTKTDGKECAKVESQWEMKVNLIIGTSPSTVERTRILNRY